MFKNEGCNDIISYSEYLEHINNCEYNYNLKYKCCLKKYNYYKKDFINWDFFGNKTEINIHFNLCALNKIKCLFCKNIILQMNLEEHVKNKCIFRIINYPNEKKYIGQKHNNIKEGYGIEYYYNGDKYEGLFKNDIREGNGIYYFSDGDRYEG